MSVIDLTKHAVRRYRERFDPKASEQEIAALVRAAHLAPRWVLEFCHALQRDSLVLRNGPALFVVIPLEDGTERVLTCVPMAWKEESRRKADAARNRDRKKRLADRKRAKKRRKPSTH